MFHTARGCPQKARLSSLPPPPANDASTQRQKRATCCLEAVQSNVGSRNLWENTLASCWSSLSLSVVVEQPTSQPEFSLADDWMSLSARPVIYWFLYLPLSVVRYCSSVGSLERAAILAAADSISPPLLLCSSPANSR